MQPRVLLLTGKGGVGKTTTAAATACAAGRSGERVLVMSTDAAHSLGDAFGADVGATPSVVAPGVWAQHVDVQRQFEESWHSVRRYLAGVLDAAGVDSITAGELTVLPGVEEVLALLELRRHARSGEWDVVVVDCAATAETLRLLALPEALGWYMERLFPANRRLVRALSPVLSRAAGVPMPPDDVFGAVERLHTELADLRSVLTGKHSSVRLVLTPERVVLAEARRSWTTLSLFGYAVDGVVVNRVFPEAPGDAWRATWAEAQAAVLTEVGEAFSGLPRWLGPYQDREPVGASALTRLADDLYGAGDALVLPRSGPLDLREEGGEVVMTLALPLAEREDVDLARHGDDLVVSVGSYRRVMALPTALRRLEVRRARLHDGVLRVRFGLEVPE